jgi:hypothetical protein
MKSQSLIDKLKSETVVPNVGTPTNSLRVKVCVDQR